MTEDASQSHVAKLVVRSLRNIVAMGKIGEVPAVQGHEHTNYGVRFGGENTRVSITQRWKRLVKSLLFKDMSRRFMESDLEEIIQECQSLNSLMVVQRLHSR